jgi:hypothetical protein
MMRTGVVRVDAGGEILGEYKTYCSYRGQPGAGDTFFRWLHDNEFVEERCQRVELTQTDAGYEEFPETPELSQFDPSDKKFVASALAQEPHSEVVVAVDRGWRRHEDALANVGVSVLFLCAAGGDQDADATAP